MKKIVAFLLKRTEHLKNVDMRSLDDSNPKHRRMKGMLEKRALLERAANGQAQLKNAKNKPDISAPFSKTIANSLAAKQAAMNPKKQAKPMKKNPRPQQAGRGR
jgi:uncharacterized pyridoxamine 5'-phosphate oxidase family protein